ncbi:helix-turn-helix domain-containing protein [Streptomyces phaeochromogenes]|uniref:helix-turn-helix domain-containing protein n=1 Tax=Streptomyces phaeochromogenes TaxID=1923 RepID=UPI002E1639E5|nr:transposase family protein [Streptomyces phaeochromogenes]
MVDHGRVVGNGTRTVNISNRRITGLTGGVIAELVAEIGPLWHARQQVKLASRPRKRAVGGGPKHRLVFVDRLLATLVHLCHGATHDVLACWFGVERATITRAINAVRPLRAERGCTVRPDVRPRTWPRSSTTSARSGRPASSTAPRSVSGDPPRDVRIGTRAPASTTRFRPSGELPCAAPARRRGGFGAIRS